MEIIETPLRLSTVLAGEEISCNDLNFSSGIEWPSACLKAAKTAGGSNEATRLENPYSRRILTTLVPMKPLDPVTKIGRPTIQCVPNSCGGFGY